MDVFTKQSEPLVIGGQYEVSAVVAGDRIKWHIEPVVIRQKPVVSSGPLAQKIRQPPAAK